MLRILIMVITISWVLTQQANLYAQTDMAPPVDTPTDTPVDTPTDTPIDTPDDAPTDTPTDTPDEEGDMPEEEIETPVGEVAPVEETGGGGGGGGGGGLAIAAAVGLVAVVVVLSNRRSQLEKTFVEDSTTGSALTRLSSASKNQFHWSMDYGSISSETLNGYKQSSNPQQVLNFRVGRSWSNGFNAKVNFGLAHNSDVEGDLQQRQWFSAGVNKSNLFKANDNLSLSLGQRFDRDSSSETSDYFLPTSLSEKNLSQFSTTTHVNVFDLKKNILDSGRYINLSYVRPISVNSALNWQIQYSPKDSGDSFMTVNWQYRY